MPPPQTTLVYWADKLLVVVAAVLVEPVERLFVDVSKVFDAVVTTTVVACTETSVSVTVVVVAPMNRPEVADCKTKSTIMARPAPTPTKTAELPR